MIGKRAEVLLDSGLFCPTRTHFRKLTLLESCESGVSRPTPPLSVDDKIVSWILPQTDGGFLSKNCHWLKFF